MNIMPVRMPVRMPPTTVESLVDELEDARQIARLNAMAGAMIVATMSKAKLLGLDKGVNDEDDDVRAIQITVIRASKN